MPDSTNETTGTSYAKTRTEGTWYLHVRGIDGSGTGGATSHYCFTVDTSAPGAPAVTAPLTGGSATKLLWDTSSLSGSGGLQIGARFDGAYAPPEADPVSAVVDRVEVIDDGGPGDVRQQSEPAQAYALEQPAARSPQPAARSPQPARPRLATPSPRPTSTRPRANWSLRSSSRPPPMRRLPRSR